MQAVRRKALLSPLRSSLPAAERSAPDIADALTAPVRPASHGEIVAMRTADPLDDSLEDIWPGITAEAAACRAMPQPAPEPYRHPQCVLDAIAEAEAARKPRKPRAPKAEKAPKAPKEPKAKKPRKAKAETVAPVEAAVEAPAPVRTAPPVRQPAGRAALGQRRQAAAPLPTAAKRMVEGSSIPAQIVGTVSLTGSFRASTGDTLVIDVEGVNNVARGIVVWAGPLQDQVRAIAASGGPARIAVRQPSNPRFKPAVSAISAA